ncbi:transcription factor 20 isoform X2 [Narcine bancroftii]
MQSYREQSSYHGNQRLLHQEAQETSRLGDYGQHHQGQMFSGYGNRPVSEGCDQQLYLPFRREPTDYYYPRGKELSSVQTHRRLAGGLQSGYGPQQAGGYSVQYLSEGQWRPPHASMPAYGHFEQDTYTSQFSPGSAQQQLRHQPFQATPASQGLAQPPPSSAAHLSQLVHQSSSALLAKYQHRTAPYNTQHFQPTSSTSTTTTTTSTSSSSSSYLSPEGYSQPPGQGFDGYHASGQCDGYPVSATVAPGYGSQAGYTYQPPVAKPCFEQAKPMVGQQHTHRGLQYSTPAKIALLNQQFASYCSADIPAKSPMPFHQNFSPGSNPSPATPMAQSPSCSSTPSPLLVTTDGLQCGPGSMGMGVRGRILQQIPQPSPTPAGLMQSPGSQPGAYEGFGLEAGAEKQASDLGLSSLTALSSQVANIPNTVQHLLISDSLAMHRRQARRSARRAGAPGEPLGPEEQLKSPQTESLDGGCSSSSEDPAERVRQLSGQSGCSEQAFKSRRPEAVNAACSPAGSHGDGTRRPLSKEELMVQMCQETKPGGAMATLAEQGPRQGEKPVGVIVSRESMVSREDIMGVSGHEEEQIRQVAFPVSGERTPGRGQQPGNSRGIASRSAAQNGNGLGHTVTSDPMAARLDSSKSPSCLAYGFRDVPRSEGGYHQMQYPAVPYGQLETSQFPLGDRKVIPSKAEKSHSLLQEALQANYPGRKLHPSYVPDLQYSGFMDPSLQPAYPVLQMIELTRKDGLGNSTASSSIWGDGRALGPGFGAEQGRPDLEPHIESGTSERKSVICDVSPSRPFGRSSTPLTCGQARDQEFVRGTKGDKFCKSGQSVIQTGIPGMTETRIKGEMGQGLGQQRNTGQYADRDPRTLSPHWKYDPSELVRGSTMISAPLPMGTMSNFPHQALNNRSTRARRPFGRGAGRGGMRRRPSSRAAGSAFLTRMSLVKQEGMPEAVRAGHFSQSRDHLLASLDKVAMYPGSANTDTLSSLLSKQISACSLGLETEATMRYPIHSQKHMRNSEGASDWANTTDVKNLPAEICKSGIQKEPRLSAVQLEPGGHPSLQMFSPPIHEAQSPHLAEQSMTLGKHSPKKQNNAAGQEDSSVQSSILSRRRIRSFISPIPAKRFCQEPKAKDLMLPHNLNNSQCCAGQVPVPKPELSDESHQMNDEKDSTGGSLSPAASLTSPGKTKTLPPRKGRGLKLEAIVQKITSPNGRKFPPAGMLDGASDSLTLEDILSVKEAGWERAGAAMVQSGYKVDGDPKEGTDVQARSAGGPREVGHANCSQICGGSSPSARVPHHPDSKPCGPSRPLSCALALHAGESPAGVTPKAEAVALKGYFPSGKKRGRPLGSINKQKRHRQECQGPPQTQEEVEEVKSKVKMRPERKKPTSHPRRRRKMLEGPLELPQEPEIKLKHSARGIRRRRGDFQDKGFSPYVLLERKREAALCTIINTQDDQNRAQKGVKGQQGPISSAPPPSCAGKALPTSSHMVQGPLVTDSSTHGILVCCLCGKCANHRDLGDLFGPYYPHQYAGTLPKNPPPKKMVPAQSRVVRHRSMPDLLKTGQSGDEGKEFGTILGHSRFKRRHYSEDCTPSWASPRNSKGHRRCYCCVKTSVDLRTQRFKSELGPQVELQLPQLPLDPNELWIHESCVLWASGVYLISGRLYGLQEAVEMAREMKCSHCQEPGATLGCYCKGCPLNYHYICALEADCFLNEENFSMKCPKHKHRATKGSSTEQSERG